MRMARILSLGAVLGALFVCSAVLASGPTPVKTYREPLSAVLIDGLAIDSTRYTGWIDVDDDACVSLEIAYTNSAAEAVTVSCETHDSASTANGSGFDLPKMEDSSTAGTIDVYVPGIWSNAVSGNESWTFTVCRLPHRWINCYFDGTGADPSDVITVRHVRQSP